MWKALIARIVYGQFKACLYLMSNIFVASIGTVWNDKLQVVSCYFKKINLQVASYFLRVAILKEQIYELQIGFYDLKLKIYSFRK